ncbi:MAG: hypothetical protein JWQ75_564 [Pseudarthrobacter sp.]|nr:hypothetical protein [Pseudarthrobacter sp.]
MSVNAKRPSGKEPRSDSDARVTWSNFWKRPEIVVPVVIGLAAAAWGVAASLQPPRDPVADCRASHPEAKGKPVRTGVTGGAGGTAGAPQSYVIEGCAQPGTSGVASDGLWRVELTIHGIPGTAMVDPYTQVEIYKTDCSALGIDYLFANQGATTHIRHLLQDGQTVSGNDGEPENIFQPNVPDEVVEASGSGDQLIVFNNGRNQLDSLSCEPLSALSAR